jgi:protein-S-isoprenylcysteine O-methyltransferase Ste14
VIFGIAVVLLGMAAVVVSQMLGVPAEWFRIGGLALCLVGSLAVGFGLLLRAANKAAHADGSGPGA